MPTFGPGARCPPTRDRSHCGPATPSRCAPSPATAGELGQGSPCSCPRTTPSFARTQVGNLPHPGARGACPCLTPLPSMASTTCALPSPHPHSVRFGCVARGAPGIGHRRGVVALPPGRARHRLGRSPTPAWGGFIASRFLPGRNLTWCGLFRDGRSGRGADARAAGVRYPACQSRAANHRRGRGQPHHCLSPSARARARPRARLQETARRGIFFRGHDRGRGRPVRRVTEITRVASALLSLLHRGGLQLPYWAVRLALARALQAAAHRSHCPGVYGAHSRLWPVAARDLDGPGR